MILVILLFFVSISSSIQLKTELEPESRIVGGSYAEPHQFPWQVAIYLNYIRIFKCGGTIIHEKWVLTAAHCLKEGMEEDFLVLAGTNINSLGSGSVHRVSKIILHENFFDFRNDIALVKIADQFKLDHTRKIIELGSKVIPDGDSVIVSGWGRESTGGNLPTKLKWIELKKMNDRDCALFTEISEGIICLLSPENEGACSGDSGGPAVHNGKIIGVANFVVTTCGSKYPDGYANVATYINWIQKYLEIN